MSNLTDALFEAYREDLVTTDFMMESLKILDLSNRYKTYNGYETKGVVAMMAEVWTSLRHLNLPSGWKKISVYATDLNKEKPAFKFVMIDKNDQKLTFDQKSNPEGTMAIASAIYRHHKSMPFTKKYNDAVIRFTNHGTEEPGYSCTFGKKSIFGKPMNESTEEVYSESFHPIKSLKLHDLIKKERDNEKVKGSGEFGQKLWDIIGKYVTKGDISEVLICVRLKDNQHDYDMSIKMITPSGAKIDGLAYLGMNASRQGKEDNYYVVNKIDPTISNFLNNATYEGKKLKGFNLRYYNDEIGLAYTMGYVT